MKPIRWSFVMVMISIGILSTLSVAIATADTNADDKVVVNEKEALQLRVNANQLEEKYCEDFWKEDSHVFDVKLCTKEAVEELTELLELQQRLNKPDSETAKTFAKLSHAVYGNGVEYGNIPDSRKHAKEFAKEALRLDPKINDCLTLGLAGVKTKGHACKGRVCIPEKMKEEK